jgi:methylated-DNA-[protein]-cysteine S-methyltransferase
MNRVSAPERLDAGVQRRLGERAEAEGLLDVAFTTLESPVGDLLLAATPRGLVELAFLRGDLGAALEQLARRVSPRLLEAPRRLEPVRRQLDEYFTRRRTAFDLALDRSLMGPFARRVLGRTERIGYGHVSTYSEVARNIGAPRAARAVGNALAANPIALVVPCHRVLRSGGALGGYGGGLDRKEWLLDLEGARASG